MGKGFRNKIRSRGQRDGQSQELQRIAKKGAKKKATSPARVLSIRTCARICIPASRCTPSGARLGLATCKAPRPLHWSRRTPWPSPTRSRSSPVPLIYIWDKNNEHTAIHKNTTFLCAMYSFHAQVLTDNDSSGNFRLQPQCFRAHVRADACHD